MKQVSMIYNVYMMIFDRWGLYFQLIAFLFFWEFPEFKTSFYTAKSGFPLLALFWACFGVTWALTLHCRLMDLMAFCRTEQWMITSLKPASFWQSWTLKKMKKILTIQRIFLCMLAGETWSLHQAGCFQKVGAWSAYRMVGILKAASLEAAACWQAVSALCWAPVCADSAALLSSWASLLRAAELSLPRNGNGGNS